MLDPWLRSHRICLIFVAPDLYARPVNADEAESCRLQEATCVEQADFAKGNREARQVLCLFARSSRDNIGHNATPN